MAFGAPWLAAWVLGAACSGRLSAEASSMFVNMDDLPQSDSLADGFKVSLVRPPGESANSGTKSLVNFSAMELLEDDEIATLDAYDALFEKYSLFCNGRWLGAQVLQDSQDLMYMQHITYMKRPDAIIETGTYKGGLTYFFASLLDMIDGGKGDAQILSVDVHHPDMVFAAKWFCPVCADCIRPYETDLWQRRVRFLQGQADSEAVYNLVLNHLWDIGVMRFIDHTTGLEVSETEVKVVDGQPSAELVVNPDKNVLVNLDANHEYDGLLKELFFFAPLVSKNSYLIVQDTKLDKIWGTKGPTAALERFLSVAPVGEFVIEHELKFHAYSQHTYLRRAQVSVPYTHFLQAMFAITRERVDGGSESG